MNDDNFGLLTPRERKFVEAHDASVRKAERKRILALWDAEMECLCEEPMQHLRARIKGKSK